MFDDLNRPNPSSGKKVDGNEAFELLQDLGKNTPEEIRRQRAYFRVAVKIAVTLQPGSASDMLKYKVQGATGDISEGGLSGLFPLPVSVGDIYRLTFDREKFDMPMTFARCVRCRLVREDAYEAGFSFFSPITLPENAQQSSESDLLG
ncbi:MAG: PilZ domain-containing protein [Planctomycetota bacterium]|jgi:c-di-GMP-binding flagellar brake protein YcgR